MSYYVSGWAILGKALAETGDKEQAIEVYEKGILVAEEKGDRQAVKEIQVFLKRLMNKLYLNGN